MLTYLHNIAFAVLPAIVPTPRSKLPAKPTPTETLTQRIEQVKEAMLALHLKRAELKGEERQLDILLKEYELSRAFFAERDGADTAPCGKPPARGLGAAMGSIASFGA